MKKLVFLVHYFPPLNSAGARRIEGLSKYFVREGNQVTVVTTRKIVRTKGLIFPNIDSIKVLEIGMFGTLQDSVTEEQGRTVEATSGSGGKGLIRWAKDIVLLWFGQIPDPRLSFAFAMLSPFLDKRVQQVIKEADAVIGSTPPWPMLLAAHFCKWRFSKKIVLDYRDNFSRNHAMPGSNAAKKIEELIDKKLVTKADLVVTVSEPISDYYRKWNSAAFTVRNGCDHEMISSIRTKYSYVKKNAESPIVIRFLGTVSKFSIPYNLFSAISLIISENCGFRKKIRIEYFGESNILKEFLKKNHRELRESIQTYDTVPYHESIGLMVSSDYLLFAEVSDLSDLSAKGVLTTKLSEYLSAGRPIIADIAPESLAGSTIKMVSANHLVSTNVNEIKQFLLSPKFLEPEGIEPSSTAFEFSRLELAKKYLLAINQNL
jgi:hypothetical protein